MYLILQGPKATPVSIEPIAALAFAAAIHPGQAGVFRCESVTHSAVIEAQVAAACFANQIDYAFIPALRHLSDFKLVAMDMDSTLITIECIDEIADMHGLKPEVSAITEAAMRGELDFNESLTRRVALLKGLDAGALQRVVDERLKLSPGAEKMLAGVKAAGLHTLLVSGGFTYFTDRMKERLGLDFSHANRLDIVDGKLTGRVLGGIVNAEEKKATVERVCGELGTTSQQAIVMGDGANDLQMMAIAGMSVAFRAKPIVRAQATVALNFVGLDGILAMFAPS